MKSFGATQSMGGTLGARPFETYDRPSAHESRSLMDDLSTPSAQYAAGREAEPSPAYHQYPTQGSGPRNFLDFHGQNFSLGARPLEATEERQYKERGALDNSLAKRAGLYDVFAPSGPIGIVVDTTKDGPAVHSLKSTSPMLGLINPGDLIIALDDEDTRFMTAAALTRMMAKKSRMKERKITLLAMDNY